MTDKKPQNCGTGYCSCIECQYDECVQDKGQCNNGCLINKTTKALKLAEEAAEFARNMCLGMNWSTDLPDEALAAIREALAEPDIEEMTLTQIAARHEQAEQEPVLCVECGKPTMHMGNKCYACCQKDTKDLEDALKSWDAAPVRTKDLTDVDLWKLWEKSDSNIAFARAVIAADREKNK